MSSTATAATARKITTRVRQAVGPAFRAETVSQGPYTFRVVVRRADPDSLTADLGGAGRHASLIVREVMGLEVTSGIVRTARGVTLVLTVTDPDARKDTIAENEAARTAALDKARAELSDGAPAPVVIERVAISTADALAALEEQPIPGRSERIAARLSAVRYVKVVGPNAPLATWRLLDRETDALVGTVQRTTPAHATFTARFRALDAHGYERVAGALSRSDAATRLMEWLEQAADRQRAEGERAARLMAHRTAMRQADRAEADSGHDTATAAPSNAELWR